MEIWKKIMDFEDYEVSSLGQVRSIKFNKNRILKYYTQDTNIYPQVMLYKKGQKTRVVKIHRLVAETFIPNPENKPQVNHKNGIKADNRVENLEWVSNIENQKHAWDTGLKEGSREALRSKTAKWKDSNNTVMTNQSKEWKENARKASLIATMKVVSWYHESYGIVTCYASELVRRFPLLQLSAGTLSHVLHGRREHHKGWRLSK